MGFILRLRCITNYNPALYFIKMKINAVHVKRQPSAVSVADRVPLTMDGLSLCL